MSLEKIEHLFRDKPQMILRNALSLVRKQVFGTHATAFEPIFRFPRKRKTRSCLNRIPPPSGEARPHACGCGSNPPGSGPGFGRTTPVVGTGEPRNGGS